MHSAVLEIPGLQNRHARVARLIMISPEVDILRRGKYGLQTYLGSDYANVTQDGVVSVAAAGSSPPRSTRVLDNARSVPVVWVPPNLPKHQHAQAAHHIRG